MDRKIETGNITDNTGHASRNPNPAPSNTSERSLASRDSQPASRPTDDDEISLKDLILKIQEWWRYLFSKRLIILIVGLLGGSLGLIYSINNKPIYEATLTFVLEEESKSGLGNLGGIAAIAGINIGGGSGGGIFQGDNILELYKSRSMLTKTLLSSSDDNDSLLIDRYIGFNDLKKSWENNIQLAGIHFSLPEENFTLQHDSIIGVIVNSIKESNIKVFKPDKKTSLIQVVTTSRNEAFSKDFTEVLVQNVNNFYVETKIKKSLENLNILQHQTDSVRKELISAIGGVALAEDANPNLNPSRQILKVPSTKKQVDVQANQSMLIELVKNLEMAKISLRKEMPLIQVVDRPILPLKKERFGKLKGIVIGGILAGFLIIFFLITKRFISNILKK